MTALVLLMACDTPSVQFLDVEPHRIEAGGLEFDVRFKDGMAEAKRVTPMKKPKLDPVLARAALAIERASGCGIYDIAGDVIVSRALLDCPGGPDWSQLPKAPAQSDMECYTTETWESPDGKRTETRMICQPI